MSKPENQPESDLWATSGNFPPVALPREAIVSGGSGEPVVVRIEDTGQTVTLRGTEPVVVELKSGQRLSVSSEGSAKGSIAL